MDFDFYVLSVTQSKRDKGASIFRPQSHLELLTTKCRPLNLFLDLTCKQGGLKGDLISTTG